MILETLRGSLRPLPACRTAAAALLARRHASPLRSAAANLTFRPLGTTASKACRERRVEARDARARRPASVRAADGSLIAPQDGQETESRGTARDTSPTPHVSTLMSTRSAVSGRPRSVDERSCSFDFSTGNSTGAGQHLQVMKQAEVLHQSTCKLVS